MTDEPLEPHDLPALIHEPKLGIGQEALHETVWPLPPGIGGEHAVKIVLDSPNWQAERPPMNPHSTTLPWPTAG